MLPIHRAPERPNWAEPGLYGKLRAQSKPTTVAAAGTCGRIAPVDGCFGIVVPTDGDADLFTQGDCGPCGTKAEDDVHRVVAIAVEQPARPDIAVKHALYRVFALHVAVGKPGDCLGALMGHPRKRLIDHGDAEKLAGETKQRQGCEKNECELYSHGTIRAAPDRLGLASLHRGILRCRTVRSVRGNIFTYTTANSALAA